MRISIPRRGRKAGPCLTEVAHQVLQLIEREGFQTFQELRADALNGRNRTYSWNLMKKLVKMNHLQVIRGDGGEIRGWSLLPKPKPKSPSAATLEGVAEYRAPVYKTSFEHDVILREMKRLLCQSPAVTQWIPEYVLKAQATRRLNSPVLRDRRAVILTVPDAVLQFQFQNRSYKAAIELELTRKSKRRIFQKIESHIISTDFQYAFYIASDESLLKLLWTIYCEVRTHSLRVKLRTQQNGIYFITLENLRKLGLDAEFKGIQDTLRLRDLAT